MGRIFRVKNSPYWYIDYTYRGKRIRKALKGVTSKAEAEAILHETLAKLRKQEYFGIREPEEILFEDFLKKYLELSQSTKRPSSYRRDQTNAKNALNFFRGYYLREIQSNDIEIYLARRKEKVSTATRNRELAFLKHLFRKATEWGYLRVNPAQNIRFLKEPPGRVRYLDEREREALEKALVSAPIHLQIIVTIAFSTGMRLGEILSLRWRDIDFKAKLIHVRDSKTHRARRLPITQKVREALLLAKKHLPINLQEDWIFLNPETGRPIKCIKTAWRTLLKRAGIKNLRFHDLRHDFASRLVMKGIDLRTVQEILGHRTLNMVQRYSHLSPEYVNRVLNYLDEDPEWQKIGKQEVEGNGNM